MEKFMVTLITDGTATTDMSPDEMREMGEQMGSFMEEISSAGVLLHTDALGPSSSARTLRYGKEGRAVVTDGPFAESKEQMAGYMVIECGDLDEAMDWVRRMPVPGGAVEVRPIADRQAADRS
jgi:hypothetical protein